MLFSTTRLIVSELTKDDAIFVKQLLNTEAWLKYIGDRKVRTTADAEKYLAEKIIKAYTDFGFGFWKVALKDVGTPIGMVGLVKRPSLEDIDIGFAYLPEYEGQGFGYESAAATIDFARITLSVKKLSAITVPYNRSSIKLLEKLGFVFNQIITLPDDPEELMLYKLDLDSAKTAPVSK